MDLCWVDEYDMSPLTVSLERLPKQWCGGNFGGTTRFLTRKYYNAQILTGTVRFTPPVGMEFSICSDFAHYLTIQVCCKASKMVRGTEPVGLRSITLRAFSLKTLSSGQLLRWRVGSERGFDCSMTN
jgi:hypothetical protein